MKKIAIIFLMIVSIGCDDRPPGAYDDGSFSKPINVENLEFKGIKYLCFDLPHSDTRSGWVVDYSQFFTKDTLVIDGWIWVRTNKTEQERRKEQKIPLIKE